MNSRLRIIVTGLIAQHPTLAGVAWDYLQYVLGLHRLGHDVYYFEDSGEWPYTLDGGVSGDEWVARDCQTNLSHLSSVMKRFGLDDKWAYHFPTNSEWFGLSAAKRREVIQSADLLINISGTLECPANYRQIPRLVYIDSDPGFTQVKLMLPDEHRDFCQRVEVHDLLFSFGESINKTALTAGREWIPTRQPIVLSEWKSNSEVRPAFTTVMSWTSYQPLVLNGRRFGQKDLEFIRFIELPQLLDDQNLEVAINGTMHTNWESGDGVIADVAQENQECGHISELSQFLSQAGWRVADAGKVGATMDAYRDYIQSSLAEWSVAKHGYVVGNTGWFSCRSACYLASGKPVVVQNTGFDGVLPVGEGILQFSTLEEAMEGISAVRNDYPTHARSARQIASAYFDSEKILSRLVDESMNKPSEVSFHRASNVQ
ncbi:hypothetical protein [Haliea sp. E17]|uniref:hypothetical protein n=1 Tax=Haliea sp. E17 TaxID=3401576 RepID=UPI003AAE561F